MCRFKILFTALLLSILFQTAYSQETSSDSGNTTESSGNDPRQLVEMPDLARKLMREDMLDHLSALSEIIASLNLHGSACQKGHAPSKHSKSKPESTRREAWQALVTSKDGINTALYPSPFIRLHVIGPLLSASQSQHRPRLF